MASHPKAAELEVLPLSTLDLELNLKQGELELELDAVPVLTPVRDAGGTPSETYRNLCTETS